MDELVVGFSEMRVNIGCIGGAVDSTLAKFKEDIDCIGEAIDTISVESNKQILRIFSAIDREMAEQKWLSRTAIYPPAYFSYDF